MRPMTRRENFSTPPAPNSRPVCSLPRDVRYNGLLLTVMKNGSLASAADIAAAIDHIVLRLNGDDKRTIVPAELFYVNALNEEPFYAGQVYICLREFWREHLGDQDYTAWGTYGVNSFEMEVVYKNYSGTYSAALSVRCDDATDPKTGLPAPIGNIVEWKRRTLAVTHVNGAAEVLLSDLPRNKPIARVHFFTPSGVTIDEVEVKVGDKVIHSGTALELDEHLTKYGFDPALANTFASGFSLVFDSTQRIGDILQLIDPKTGLMTSAFDIKLRVSNANATTQQINVLTETLGGI